MDSESFKEQVNNNLKKLDREQIVFFTWLCAVRAFPFIGAKGHFNYWKEKRQQHLYAIFRALDISNFYITVERGGGAAYAVTAAAYAVTAAAYAANAYDAANAYAARDAANAVTNAAYAAADAARDAYAYVAYAAADAARDAAAYVYANVYANAKANAKLQKTILSDIQIIQKGDHTFKNILDLDGKVWNNFQTALEKEGCKYWGDLYESIYKRNFVFSEQDKEALERRMNVPKEIQEQGAAAVVGYLVELEKGAKNLNEARIIILGEKGAGKTCLARRLKNPDAKMTTDEDSTAGVDTTLWKPEQEDINIHIWDFAGHVVTHAVHQFFLSERCLYILVYDGRTEERNRIEYWLNNMKNYGGESKVFILVNKKDPHPQEIPINRLNKKYPIAGFHTFSIQDDRNELEKFRNEVVEYIKNNPSWSNQKIPANYFNVKKELEQHFTDNKKEEYIDIETFNQIAKKSKVDEHEELLKNLHALGICLHYKNMADLNTLVLNPEWISNGIYAIINWGNKQNKYTISMNDFSIVFKDDAVRYPVDKHRFLFELMKTYELAYETEKKNFLIIPYLLHKDQPETLPIFPMSESLMLRYNAEQLLPPDTISRFIVRHNEDIKKERKEYVVWRYGVVLKDGNGSTALVMEWEEEKRITIEVKGDNKTAYLDKLRNTLNNIFNSYKSKKPELQYRIERFGLIPDEIEKSNPLWLPDNQIYNHYVNGRQYYDAFSNKDIPMANTVNNYHITAESLIMGGQGNIIDKSVRNKFNFHNCNIELQGILNDLAGTLRKKGEIEDAEVLEDAVEALSEAKKCQTPEEIETKGFVNKLKRIIKDLGDENSNLHKTVKGIKHGISIAQDIAQGYNDIAQWCGLPQVPKPFLKKEKSQSKNKP